jgi:DNA-binding transcriptional LysR family regulator
MQAMERKSDAASELVGEVKLATFESLAHYLLVPNLPAFSAQYPQLQVELLVNRNLADLSRREADLALRIADPRHRDHAPDYIAHCVGTFRFELYCTPEALARVDGDWRRLPHIAWDAAWFRLPMVEWLNILFPGQTPVLRSNTMQTHYTAACCGLGAALLPRFIGDNDARLMRVPTGMLETQQELWLMYHRDLKGSGRVLAMRDFVRDLCERELAKYV